MTAPNGQPGVVITLDTIYREVMETKDIVRGLADDVKSLSRKDDDHETRIRALERKVWMALGGGSALGGAAGALATAILGG